MCVSVNQRNIVNILYMNKVIVKMVQYESTL